MRTIQGGKNAARPCSAALFAIHATARQNIGCGRICCGFDSRSGQLSCEDLRRSVAGHFCPRRLGAYPRTAAERGTGTTMGHAAAWPTVPCSADSTKRASPRRFSGHGSGRVWDFASRGVGASVLNFHRRGSNSRSRLLAKEPQIRLHDRLFRELVRKCMLAARDQGMRKPPIAEYPG